MSSRRFPLGHGGEAARGDVSSTSIPALPAPVQLLICTSSSCGLRHRFPGRDRSLHHRERARISRTTSSTTQMPRRSSMTTSRTPRIRRFVQRMGSRQGRVRHLVMVVQGRRGGALSGPARDLLRRASFGAWHYPPGPSSSIPALQDSQVRIPDPKRHYSRYTPEMVEETCGIPQDLFLKVADALPLEFGPRAEPPRS